jgi:hypothetical protein
MKLFGKVHTLPPEVDLKDLLGNNIQPGDHFMALQSDLKDVINNDLYDVSFNTSGVMLMTSRYDLFVFSKFSS